MADNTVQSGADTIATDDVTTLNGGASSGVKVQRTKTGYGDDNTYRDVSATFPLPAGNTAQVSGTLSASDAVVAAPVGDGTLVSGASTAGSVVALAVPAGMSSWTLLLKGYASGNVYSEASTNSTNGTDGDWVEVKGRRTGTAPGTESVLYAYTSNGYYRGNDGGFLWIRARLIGGTGPTVQLTASSGTGAVFLNSGIPAGSSTIGAITGAGTAGTPATGVQTVQGISGATALNVSQTTSLPAGTNMIGSFKKAPSSTGTITSPALSASSFTVLAANTARLGATVYNESAYTVYLALATSASVTAYTVQVPSGGYFELPNDSLGYVGAITGIALTASGNLRVTELT